MIAGQPVQIANRPLECKHCGGREFVHRTSELSSALAAFLNDDWFAQYADIFVCVRCGFLHWFLNPAVEPQAPVEAPVIEESPEEIPVEEPATQDDLGEATECLACHQAIPAGSATCPACGWSYK
jgi:hypothetical protein